MDKDALSPVAFVEKATFLPKREGQCHCMGRREMVRVQEKCRRGMQGRNAAVECTGEVDGGILV